MTGGSQRCQAKEIIIPVFLCASSLLMIGCGGGGKAPTTTAAPATSTTTTTTTTLPYGCTTDLWIDSNSKQMAIKGMAMDDTTMSQCPEKILGLWPNTNAEHVKSLRLFAAWKSAWGNDAKRQKSWEHVLNFTKDTGATIFLGVDTTTDNNENEQQWKWALELMKKFDKMSIMGVSFGNEMLNKKGINWDAMFPWVQGKIKEMDAAGFSEVKVTLVWSMSVLPRIHPGNFPFLDQMYKQYSTRWVWAVNPYAIWSPGMKPSPANCQAKTAEAISIDQVKGSMTAFRKAVNQYTGKTDDPMWIGETGWASPLAGSQYSLAFCKDWYSLASLKTYYQNIIEWDGTLNDGVKGPDQIFYFTNRDALDQGDPQPFGLVDKCANPKCKLQSHTVQAGEVVV